jgi:hypothetical protein
MEYGKYYQWKPWKYKTDWIFTDYLASRSGGLTLLFQEYKEEPPDQITMKVIFPGWELRFRVTGELYQSPFDHWCDNNRTAFINFDETEGSPLFIVEGSDYLRDYKIETGGMFDALNRPLKHYHVVDREQVIDVISTLAPRIEIYKGSELIECVPGQDHAKIYNLDGTPKAT